MVAAEYVGHGRKTLDGFAETKWHDRGDKGWPEDRRWLPGLPETGPMRL